MLFAEAVIAMSAMRGERDSRSNVACIDRKNPIARVQGFVVINSDALDTGQEANVAHRCRRCPIHA